MTAEPPLTDELWTPFVTALANAEAALHGNPVNIMRVVISDYAAQPEYDPTKLRVWEVSGQGQRGAQGGIYLPLDICLKAKKIVGYGRAGTCFFRGVLNSLDVDQGAGGDYVLKAGVDAGLNNLTNAIISQTATALDALTGEFVLPAGIEDDETSTGNSVRIVSSILASGISINRRDHRYFDTARSDDGVGVGT